MNYSRINRVLMIVILFIFQGHYALISVAQAQVDASTKEIDCAYTLEAVITGYTGIGGDIDGIRNPVLQARQGDMVRITIINGEPLTHDIALEKQGVKSGSIIEEGASTSITFRAENDDTYYCSIPGHRAAGMEGRFKVISASTGEVVAEGVLPRKEGKPLNLDFETGTLEDWIASGEAFRKQHIVGYPSRLHIKRRSREPMVLNQNGEYMISSGGTIQPQAIGILNSESFEVTHPYAAFLVSGGAFPDTRVELVRAGIDSVFFEITGNNHASLRPVVVDLQEYLAEQIYIRLIDKETGERGSRRADIWAHINFDDFRFYEGRPKFVNELRPEDIITLPPRDIIPHAGITAEKAVRVMDLPEGFSVTLAASEPEVVNPIAFAIDHQGRLWVAEGHTYPVKAPEGEGKDRILIFEDTDGNGTLDKRTVFIDGLNLVSGLEIGFGGVWVGAAPELLYIPIDESGDKPAGEPEILLNGWGYHDTHETLNSFSWGPDGWLYGVQGVFTHSNVGKPGTPEEERQRINAGIWRYHPTRHEFEVYAYGTSNPWGVAFNDYGHPFITACVIPHLYHVIQGGRYQRQVGEHFGPYVYNDIKTHADHVHWAGDHGPHAGNGRSGAVGGGHAHAGAMFYLGGEGWPEKYRNTLFMNNIHGARVNTDMIKREGSGYTATHRKDFLLANDVGSQWLDLQYGPGGSVWAIDWYDINQCHSPDPEVEDKVLGRIFKISHSSDEWVQVDLSQRSSLELVELQLHSNDWYVRHARRLLQERGPNERVHKALRRALRENPDITRKLRALWALHVTQGLTDADLLDLLDHDSEYIRSWAIQLLAEDEDVPDAALERFVQMAHTDRSALVRLYLASALQRIQPEDRWSIVEGLYQRSEDADDHNLPLMVWYAAEPLVEADMERALNMAMNTELSNILPFTIKRIGAVGTPEAMDVLKEVEGQLESKPNSDRYDQARQELDLIFGETN